MMGTRFVLQRTFSPEHTSAWESGALASLCSGIPRTRAAEEFRTADRILILAAGSDSSGGILRIRLFLG